MSTRTFCDACGDEMTDGTRVRRRDESGDLHDSLMGVLPKTRARRAEVRVIVRVYSEGDFCKYCALQAVDALDDRPRASPEERARLPSAGERVYRNGVPYKVTCVESNDPADDLGTYRFTVVAEPEFVP